MKFDLLKIILPILLIAGCTKATVEYFQDDNGIMYVEYNGNSNTQSPYSGEIIEYYNKEDGRLKKSEGSYKDGKLIFKRFRLNWLFSLYPISWSSSKI